MALNFLAQAYDYGTEPAAETGAAIGGVLFMLIYLAVAAVLIAGMWKLFTKAGRPGWASLIPFYNIFVLLEIAGKPAWWLVLFFVPFVNIVIGILLGIEVAKKFGYSEVFGAIVCGLLGIGYAIIGFGSAQYQGDAATS